MLAAADVFPDATRGIRDNGESVSNSAVFVAPQRALFSGDLVEYEAGIYTGDAHLDRHASVKCVARSRKFACRLIRRGPLRTAF